MPLTLTDGQREIIARALSDARDYIFDSDSVLGCAEVERKIEQALALLSRAPELRQRESAGEGVTPSRSPIT